MNRQDNEDRQTEDLRKRLAVAVRSIQWSYAVFWSLSTIQQGYVLMNKLNPNSTIHTYQYISFIE